MKMASISAMSTFISFKAEQSAFALLPASMIMLAPPALIYAEFPLDPEYRQQIFTFGIFHP